MRQHPPCLPPDIRGEEPSRANPPRWSGRETHPRPLRAKIKELDKYDEASRRELATKGDVQDVRLEVERVRAELKTDIEKVRADVEKVKYDLLKWQIGGWLALAAIMAKGFGWLGF